MRLVAAMENRSPSSGCRGCCWPTPGLLPRPPAGAGATAPVWDKRSLTLYYLEDLRLKLDIQVTNLGDDNKPPQIATIRRVGTEFISAWFADFAPPHATRSPGRTPASCSTEASACARRFQSP
jgi:hypothetical protein